MKMEYRIAEVFEANVDQARSVLAEMDQYGIQHLGDAPQIVSDKGQFGQPTTNVRFHVQAEAGVFDQYDGNTWGWNEAGGFFVMFGESA
ncbi:hypothetical protein UFOVP1313_65 [uncultured Caudovirales phage]|uniref:Uncharacterized protein n=1 Tax=uncultured Caudovirales phage TaxID=2100421 RepID=A0A6J5RVG7_9CAUD|nr:hypothetical protein UFOVP1313_65 [uncultured Caudovirales phage]